MSPSSHSLRDVKGLSPNNPQTFISITPTCVCGHAEDSHIKDGFCHTLLCNCNVFDYDSDQTLKTYKRYINGKLSPLSDGQPRVWSFYESVLNVLIGYLVAVTSQVLIFPFFGIHVPFSTNMMIGVVFTVISLIRSYTLRRLFNSIHLQGYR